MFAASQAILGIMPDYDGLKVDPHLPKEIKHAEVKRVFRGVTYNITINNSASGKYLMTVDGKAVDGKVITLNTNSVFFNVVIDL